MKRRTFVQACAAGLTSFSSRSASGESYAKQLQKFRERLELAAKDDARFWEIVRGQFLLDSEIIYLDCATIGSSPKIVVQALSQFATQIESNPFHHIFDEGLNQGLEDVRTLAAQMIGAATDEVAIMGNTTEGMNLIARGLDLQPGDEILTSNHEHAGGLTGWQYLVKRFGVKIVCLPIPVPSTTSDEIEKLVVQHVSPRTRVLSFCHVDTITGTVLPIAGIAKIARKHDCFFVCDGAQALGMLDVDVKHLGVDAYVASGHKWLLGPKGSGILYLNQGSQIRIDSLELNGGFQVYTAASGTRDVAGILALGTTIKFMQAIGFEKIAARNRTLGRYLSDKLNALPHLTRLTEATHENSSGIVTVSVDDAIGSSWSLARRLRDESEVYVKPAQASVSFGNATPIYKDHNGIRFSTHIFNTEEQIDRAVDALATILKH